MTHTIKEIAEILDVDENAARGLVKFMLESTPSLIRCRGERSIGRGAGHGPKVYQLDVIAPTSLARMITRLL